MKLQVMNSAPVKNTLIGLTGVSALLMLLGITLKIMNYGYVPPVDPNPNHLFKKDNKLYFYQDDKLLGTYTCQNTTCDYAYETSDEGNYQFHSYSDGTIDHIKLINNRFAFLVDSDDTSEYYRDSEIILYDIIRKKQVGSYHGVKNYTLGINDNIVFTSNDNNMWQILSLNEPVIRDITKFEYEYLTVPNSISSNGLISSNNIIGKTKNSWQVLSSTGSIKLEHNSNIFIELRNNYLIYQNNNNNNYYLVTLNNYFMLNSRGYRDMKFISDKVISVIDENNHYYLINFNKNSRITTEYDLSTGNSYEAKLNINDQIEVYENDKLIETI